MIYHNITDLSIYSLHTNRECNENKNNIIDDNNNRASNSDDWNASSRTNSISKSKSR